MQTFPIWISSLHELDLIYEGQQLLVRETLSNINLFQKEADELSTEHKQQKEQGLTDTNYFRDLTQRLRDKKARLNEMNVKAERVHRFLQRMTDPSVPQNLLDEYHARKRREAIIDLTIRKDGKL